MTDEKYEISEDGLRREVVGSWVSVKGELVERYVEITKSVRKKFQGNRPSYIDIYSGPGQVRIRDTQDVRDGTAVVAVRKSLASPGAGFGEVWLNDLDETNVRACKSRVEQLGQPNVYAAALSAEEAARQIRERLNKYGYHFALLDPYNLAALPFSILADLSTLRRIDMLVHVSTQDLQRNFGKDYRSGKSPALDLFAPGWREHVDLKRDDATVRRSVFEYWRRLVAEKLSMKVSDSIEHITATQNQTLYYLCLLTRAEIADRFWKVARRRPGTTPSLWDAIE